MSSLTPAERNRIRHIRGLLELYERSPGSRASSVANILTAARELGELNDEEQRRHVEESAARTREVLGQLVRADESPGATGGTGTAPQVGGPGRPQ